MSSFRTLFLFALGSAFSLAPISGCAAPEQAEERVSLEPQAISKENANNSYSLEQTIVQSAQGALKAAGQPRSVREAATAGGAEVCYRFYSQAQSRLVVVSAPKGSGHDPAAAVRLTVGVFEVGPNRPPRTVEWDAANSARFLAAVARSELFALPAKSNTVALEKNALTKADPRFSAFYAERFANGAETTIARNTAESSSATELEALLATLLPTR